VDTQTRHALKQDKFVETTALSIDWLQENRSNVIKIGSLALVVIALIVTGAIVYNNRSEQAEIAFGKAMDIYNSPLRQPGQPALPNDNSYATAADRARAANPLFVQVADHYGWLKAGANAEYFAGLTYLDLNQTASAEKELQKADGSHDKNLAALAKMALAGLYRQTGRDGQAVDLYNQVIKDPTVTVPASSAKLELAALYETSNPVQAKKLYAEIKDQDKTTAAGQIAAQKLAGK
jgi:tetratricopeptide (TPR) repeat protein